MKPEYVVTKLAYIETTNEKNKNYKMYKISICSIIAPEFKHAPILQILVKYHLI